MKLIMIDLFRYQLRLFHRKNLNITINIMNFSMKIMILT